MMLTPTPIKPLPEYQPPGMQPPRPTPVPGVSPMATGGRPAGAPRMSAPIGRTADANPSQVNIAPPAPAPVSAVAPPPPSSAPPGAPVSSFGPGNDLLSTQINPNTGGPNRTELAQKSIADWDAQNAPRLAAQTRGIGQQAAKFGRIGAGMTTNDLTGAEATYNRDRMSFSNALASGLADDTIGDQRADNNELRTERDYQTGRSDKAISDAERQRLVEEDLLNSQFGRALSRTNAGYRDSPVDTLGGFSGALGEQAAGGIGAGTDLLRGGGESYGTSSANKFAGMIPGAPDASGVPQVTKAGVPLDIRDMLRNTRAV